MGKPTGFIDYLRELPVDRKAHERIRDWLEFHEHMNFNHGYNNFDEQIRTVAAFYQPGNLVPAQVDEMTLHQDLVPTLFAILGIDPSPSASYEGFTGEVIGTSDPRPYAFNLVYRNDKTHQAVTDGTEKLMFRWDNSEIPGGVLGGPKYLFDLEGDPAEQDNVYDEEETAQDATRARWWDLLCPEVDKADGYDADYEPVSHPQCPGYEATPAK